MNKVVSSKVQFRFFAIAKVFYTIGLGTCLFID